MRGMFFLFVMGLFGAILWACAEGGNESESSGPSQCVNYYKDFDGDGFGVSGDYKCLDSPQSPYLATKDGDCDDTRAQVFPGATEVCENGLDDNCDGKTDEPECLRCTTYFKDEDNDGYGAPGQFKCIGNPVPPYTATMAGDCNDNDATVYPNAQEKCNLKDDNCDGRTDETGCESCSTHYYRDEDGDGYGLTQDSKCLDEPSGVYVATKGGDCDDKDPNRNPGAEEVCNKKDDDCDGQTDEEGAQGCVVYYKDVDNDGFGVSQDSKCLCAKSAPYTATEGGDCDDNDAGTNPKATEICDSHKDENCNGQTDEQTCEACTVFYKDEDKDGYGVTYDSRCLLAPSAPFTATKTGDCDDSDPSVNPGAVEKCNSKDDNCNGQTDEQVCTIYYYDADGDGYGVSSDSKVLCAPSGNYRAVNPGDCNDQNPSVHPGATEVGNGIDDDCDGITDAKCGADGDSDGSLLDPGEECDDGNTDTADGCLNCKFVDFQVNTWTTDDQRWPSIASLSNGGFVVVWESYGQDGSDLGVYAQRFDPNGNKVGSEFRVNTWTTYQQEYPSVASLFDRGFAVVWQSLRQDGSGYSVYGQRFDSSASKVGSEFQVNTWTTDDQWSPSITSLPNGGFVVVWQSAGQDGSWSGVYGQRFDSNGNKVGSEFQVNTWTTNDQGNPSITSLHNGGFVVVWTSYGQDASSDGVYGQRFDSNGNRVGSEFRVNTWTTYGQGTPSVTSLLSGGFVVVWESQGHDGDGYGVFGRIFSQ